MEHPADNQIAKRVPALAAILFSGLMAAACGSL